MKRLIVVFMVVGLLIGVVATHSVIAGPGAAKACKALMNCDTFACNIVKGFAGYTNVGDCVSTTRACLNAGNTGPVCFCKALDGSVFGLIDIDYGECVDALRNL